MKKNISKIENITKRNKLILYIKLFPTKNSVIAKLIILKQSQINDPKWKRYDPYVNLPYWDKFGVLLRLVKEGV